MKIRKIVEEKDRSLENRKVQSSFLETRESLIEFLSDPENATKHDPATTIKALSEKFKEKEI